MKYKLWSASGVLMCTTALCCEEHGATLSEKSVICIIRGTDTITDTFSMNENELAAIYLYRGCLSFSCASEFLSLLK